MQPVELLFRCRSSWSLSVAACCLAIAGCGDVPTDGPEKLVPVAGTVTLAGAPLAGAAVIFNPRDAKLRGGFGTTDTAGNFVAKFRGTQAGIEPGEYVVTVTKLALPDGSPVPEGKDAADVGAIQIVPPSFSDPGQSTQVVTVADRENHFTFEIPKTVKK